MSGHDAPTLRELVRWVAGDIDLQKATRWPPDVFALCATVLQETGAYRLVVDPPANTTWPPRDIEWPTSLREEAMRWIEAVDGWLTQNGGVDPYQVAPPPPGPYPDLAGVWSSYLDTPIDELVSEWPFVEHLLRSLVLADEACAGAGLYSGTDLAYVDFQMLHYLERGTCSSFSPRRVRVLPKTRTPQCGIGMRSLSMHLALVRGEVGVKWTQLPTALELKKLEILLLPWPLEVSARDFRPTDAPFCGVDADNFGFFSFDPEWTINPARVADLVLEAKQICGGPDLVVFPEAALGPDDLKAIQETLYQRFGEESPAVLAGVRAKDTRGCDENQAHLSWVPPAAAAWDEFVQPKHHRWYLDDAQIRTYRLGKQLHPRLKWWEGISVPPRQIGFFTMSDWLLFCPLVCEDLARQDPVSSVVRAVGPTLVVALLLDGPQVEQRWSGRYASVLADDPGTSVLTVSSFGMVDRSRTPGFAPSNVVGLWKDPLSGVQSITLDRPGEGVLLTVECRWETEWTADGRTDNGRAAVPVLVKKWTVGSGPAEP